MIIDPKNSNIIYAGGSYYNGSTTVMAICKSSDGGANWSHSELSTTRGEVCAMALHPTDPNILFAGGYCDENYLGKVFKSTDGGKNWSDASSGLTQNYNYVYALAIDPTAPQIMYAGCNDGIFKSTDNGASWKNLNVSFSGVCAIIIRPSSPQTIYAASNYRGIYCSVDGGTNWSPMNEGLTTLQIECLELDPVNHLLFAGTNGGGVLRCEIATAVDPIAPEPVLPGQFALKSNYPNPFNSSTTINYDVPIGVITPVNITIYNIFGQVVKTLFNGNQDAGRYTVKWDGSGNDGKPMTSGVYFCILQSGAYQSTKKMTLLR